MKLIIRQQYKGNKLKITDLSENDKFELTHGSYSVSNIQDYFEYFKKNTKNYPPILLFRFALTGLIMD